MDVESGSIRHLAEEWCRLDRNPSTRKEITDLVDSKQWKPLEERLSTRIAFGTAGLRARMEAGFARMNDLTVIQASQGLAAYILSQDPSSKSKGIVIAHDHRHNSERFAALTAAAFLRKGIKVYRYKGIGCTPLVPFGVKHFGAAGGVMITASHNPKDDNGYKVYWSNGVQIIPPHDIGIARTIESNLEVEERAWDVGLQDELQNGAGVGEGSSQDVTEELGKAYSEMVARMCTNRTLNESSPIKFVYTPMHGVGFPFASRAFEGLGFRPFDAVPEQKDPDPDFPTVKFPNPEEKGALNLALDHAETKGATIVVANDPDADRFCAAERQSDAKWKVFTGDQLGSILGHWIFEQYKKSGRPVDKLAMLASTVSSKMLAAMAEKEGFTFRETLTGFKYLGNEALNLEIEGYNAEFAYEEAIGYMCNKAVRDKDGVTALATFAELVTSLSQRSLNLLGYLDQLYDRYGYFVTSNSYFVSRDPAVTDKAFYELRYGDKSREEVKTSPIGALKLPQTLAGLPVTSIRDLTVGYDTTRPDKKPTLPTSSSSHMITFTLGGIPEKGIGPVVGTIRTSGTEPKIKFYLEANGTGERSVVDEHLAKVREALGEEWLKWSKWGFEKPKE